MDTEPRPGRLLVAAPSLVDPNFHETVVLLVVHEDEGTLGVVLNRPADLDLADALPDWGDVAASPPHVFVGGPVAQDAWIGLGEGGPDGEDDGWDPVLGPIGVVDLEREPEDLAVSRVRVFAGHAGWAPGQLDAEIEEGAWFLVGSLPGDVFTDEPDTLWHDVLARQGGVFKTVTVDPSSN